MNYTSVLFVDKVCFRIVELHSMHSVDGIICFGSQVVGRCVGIASKCPLQCRASDMPDSSPSIPGRIRPCESWGC